jgi:hypothetical protein
MMGTDIETEKAFVSMVEFVAMDDTIMSRCKQAAMTDKEYVAAKIAYERGWSSSDKAQVAEYWSHREQLTRDGELLFFDGRLVVPRATRNDVLNELHQGHGGMHTMMKRAMDTVWWPSIRNDIKKRVDTCGECQMSRPAQRREPMLSFEVPEAPGIQVHSDYFDFGGKDYVIVVDGFSGWTELLAVQNRRPKELIKVLRAYMTRNGVPRGFHSDQGSTFESAEFRAFCEKWGIVFSDNSPKHSRGNAIAEAHVKKIKHLLTTAADEDELAKGLISLMQTPVAPGKPSPAQLHLGRNLRDRLHPEVRVETRPWAAHKLWKEEKARISKKYFDRGTRALRELTPGEKVLVWHNERWQNGTVVQRMRRPRSYSVRIEETGRVLERNRVLLRTVDEDMSDPGTKEYNPYSLFQQRLPVRLLTPPRARSGAASTPANPAAMMTDPASEDDQEAPVTDEESEGEDDWGDASRGTNTPEPPTPPDQGLRTRAGRTVRAPDRYSPEPW